MFEDHFDISNYHLLQVSRILLSYSLGKQNM